MILATRTFFHRLCTLWRIAKTYDDDRARLRSEIRAGVDLIQDRTTLHADISPSKHDPSFVILVGRYRDRDYVQTFSLRSDDFQELAESCRALSREGRWGRIDAPPVFRAVIESYRHP